MAGSDDEVTAFLQQYLALRGPATEGQPGAVPGGSHFEVRRRDSGEHEVWRQGGEAPLAVFVERRTAFLAAAVFTAFGGVAVPSGPPPGTGAVREVREGGPALAGAPREALLASLLTGLLRNPGALELLLAAAGAERTAEAQATALDWLVPGDGPVH